MIAGEKANNNAANIPAEVPPITLTRAKIIMVVSEPITTGRMIVKFNNEVPLPKILYRKAATMCNPDCEVFAISRPSGYHDIVSCHFQYELRP
jgi:hypothetical protein